VSCLKALARPLSTLTLHDGLVLWKNEVQNRAFLPMDSRSKGFDKFLERLLSYGEHMKVKLTQSGFTDEMINHCVCGETGELDVRTLRRLFLERPVVSRPRRVKQKNHASLAAIAAKRPVLPVIQRDPIREYDTSYRCRDCGATWPRALGKSHMCW